MAGSFGATWFAFSVLNCLGSLTFRAQQDCSAGAGYSAAAPTLSYKLHGAFVVSCRQCGLSQMNAKTHRHSMIANHVPANCRRVAPSWPGAMKLCREVGGLHFF